MGKSKKIADANFFNVRIIVFSAILITIVLTPWTNVDSLVVPKLVILVCTAFYFIPLVFSNWNNRTEIKLLYLVVGLSLLQMVLVIFNSNSPIEQQIFGRTGRGLGLLTFLSLYILTIASAKIFKLSDSNLVIKGLVFASLLTSIYSILQRFGIDLTDWTTRTNGVIGTIGNPNFQSAFSGMALIPVLIFAHSLSARTKYFSYLLLIMLLATIYFTQSTQGYISGILSTIGFVLIWVWYRNRKFFVFFLALAILFTVILAIGILNRGPFAQYLYKISVQSRMEFWRTAWKAAIDNPVFGVGLDSIGDFSRIYRSIKDYQGVNENFDNSHNYFIEAAATGGFILMALNLSFIILTVLVFVKVQSKLKKFDANFAAFFCIWLAFQSQSLISPGSIVLLTWNAVICGAIFGFLNSVDSTENSKISNREREVKSNSHTSRTVKYMFLVIGMIITFPYFNSDRKQYLSFIKADALLAVNAAKSYPESTVRYFQVGSELLKSNLPIQALEVARSAVIFNPNSITAWSLIYMNPRASENERNQAAQEILRLDPNNEQLKNLK